MDWIETLLSSMHLGTLQEVSWLENSALDWLIGLAMAALAIAALRLAKSFVISWLQRVARRTSTSVDDLLVHTLRSPTGFLYLFVALRVLMLQITLSGRLLTLADRASFILVLLQIGVWGGRMIAFAVEHHRQRVLERNPAGASVLALLHVGALTLLWTTLLLLSLDNIGFDVTALVAGLGVGGIALALAVQNILGDLFASVSIILDKPFVVGDFIIVGEFLGTVEKIGVKTTRVRSLSGEQIVFSNNDLLGSRVRNYKKMFERRVVFQLGVTYDTELEKLERIPLIVREIIQAQDDVRFDRAHFSAYGEFALRFEVVYYVLSPDYNLYMDRQEAINLAIYRSFEEHGVRFAFPTQTLHIAGRGANGSEPALSMDERESAAMRGATRGDSG